MRTDTKLKSIPIKVKKAVADRDSFDGWPCCVYCGKPSPEPTAWSNAHYVGRAQGGLGIEENTLTLCPACHRRYDQSERRESMRAFFKEYLKTKYPNWDESKLIYRKEEER